MLIGCDSDDAARGRRIVSGADLAANFVWHADRQVNEAPLRAVAS